MLGSGQLGRMFAIAARQMGYRVHTFSPEGDTPTGQVSDLEVTASYEDLDAVRAFARDVDVVTFEFENVPGAAARAAEEIAPVRPAPAVLQTVQNRVREKTFLRRSGFPVPDFERVATLEDLRAAVARIGAPAMLKTAASGYDGKGQARIATPGDAAAAWDAIGRAEAILEEFVDFEKEVSVVAARGSDGSFSHFGTIENSHRAGILDVSMAPADVAPEISRQAVAIAQGVLDSLSVVGVLCVELFVTRDGQLLVNELAPRPHNSGHFTVDACITSQFEQQLRAVCGLPLGSSRAAAPRGNGESPRRAVGRRRARLARRVLAPRNSTASVRQDGGPAGSKDGPPDGPRSFPRRSAPGRPGGAGRADSRGGSNMTERREPSIRVVLMPKDTNAHGTIFGGVILSYIDQAGAVEAKQHGADQIVTIAMREVVFHEPVYVGDLVSFYTRLIRLGNTSITVAVEVVATRGDDVSRHVKVTEAEVTFVNLGPDRKPKPIPQK